MRATRTLVPLVLSVLLSPSLAAGQKLEGRFFPVKQSYVLGEPLIVVFEAANVGEEATSLLLGATWGECANVYGLQVEVRGAEPEVPGMRGCPGGFAGSCVGGYVLIQPSQMYTRRILLNDWYRFSEPGRYRINMIQNLQAGEIESYPPRTLGTIESEFTIVMEAGEEGSVQRAYGPVLADLSSDDWVRRDEALHILDQMAPAFLEDTILELARGSGSSVPVLNALEKLNTAGTRAELARIAQRSEWGRQPAIFALGRMGDRSYLTLLQELAGHPDRALQLAAIRSTGRLGGEDVLPFLQSLLRHPDPHVRHDAVFGLANTGSRQAAPALIEMLQDSSELVRQSAANALTQLTHRSLPLDASDPQQSSEAAQRWLRWWLLNGETADVFGPDECGELKPLD